MLSNAKNHRTFLKGPLTARPPGLPSPTRSGSAPAGCPGVTSLVFEVAVFKGLPYAATTAGANRWRPPQRAASWTGVRVADTFGDICPQQLMGSVSVTMSEDSLNLNIWTGAASSREKRPVLVRIYGGRFTGRYASDPGFDGAGLTAKGWSWGPSTTAPACSVSSPPLNSAPNPATRHPATTVSWTRSRPCAGWAATSPRSESNYVFDNLYATNLPWTDADRTVVDTLSDHVVNFATHGDPNGHGLTRSPAANHRLATTMELGDRFGAHALADPAKVGLPSRGSSRARSLVTPR